MHIIKTTLAILLLQNLSAHEHHKAEANVGNTVAKSAAQDPNPLLTGQSPMRYKSQSGWAKNPNNGKQLGSTHGGMAIDKKGNIYVNTDTKHSIIVYSPEGNLLGTFGDKHVGIHDMCIVEENGQEFIYAAHLKGPSVVKFKVDGTLVWELKGPPAHPAYKRKNSYRPTSVAVAPNGDIFVADGYGLSLIHRYNKDKKYLGSFGGKGKGDQQFMTCHGVTIDDRDPNNTVLLVCDRENRCLKRFSTEGKYIDTPIRNLRRPCSLSLWKDKIAVAELEGRAVILDKDFNIISKLGDNPNKKEWAKFHISEKSWKPNIFTAPHSCLFDANGNLYIMDWNKSGRVRKFLLQEN